MKNILLKIFLYAIYDHIINSKFDLLKITIKFVYKLYLLFIELVC